MPTKDDELDAYVAAAAGMLDLTIEPEWLPQVRAALAGTNAAATLVAAFALDDEAEPAAVFEA